MRAVAFMRRALKKEKPLDRYQAEKLKDIILWGLGNFYKSSPKESFSGAFFKKHTRIKALGAGAF